MRSTSASDCSSACSRTTSATRSSATSSSSKAKERSGRQVRRNRRRTLSLARAAPARRSHVGDVLWRHAPRRAHAASFPRVHRDRDRHARTFHIGATAAIFSVIDPVLLRSLPYPNPDRLAFVWERNRDGSRDNVGVSDDQGHRRSREVDRADVAAVGGWSPTVGDAEPEMVAGDRVSWTYFRTLGVSPAIGRDFLEEEDQPDHQLEVILSDGLWRRKFGGDPAIVGRPISVSGRPMTVIGVMPPSFDNVVTPNAKIWRVLGYAATQPFACRTCHHLRMLVRVKPGVTMASAATEIDGIFATIVAAFPKQYASVGASVIRAQEEITRQFRPALLALGGAVVLVLLIGIANVANLQLARSVRRHEEFAIRSALGASCGRVRRQLLAEGLVLALLGGIAGAIVARVSLPLLVDQLPQGLPRADAIHLDATGFAAIAAIVLALALALTLTGARRERHRPRRVAQVGPASGERRASRGAIDVRRRRGCARDDASRERHARRAKPSTLARRQRRLRSVTSLDDAGVGDRPALQRRGVNVVAYHDRLRAAVRGQVPGVQSVALTNQIPLGRQRRHVRRARSGRHAVEPRARAERRSIRRDARVLRHDADSDSARTRLHRCGRRGHGEQGRARKRCTRGATLAWTESARTPRQVRRSDRCRANRHRRYLGNVNAWRARRATTTLQWYAPESQWFFGDNDEMIVVRTTLAPSSLVQAVRRAVSSVDPTLPISAIATMDDVVARSTAQRAGSRSCCSRHSRSPRYCCRWRGLYGVLAGNVAERTREIGLRAALGAAPRSIMALVVGQGGDAAGGTRPRTGPDWIGQAHEVPTDLPVWQLPRAMS